MNGLFMKVPATADLRGSESVHVYWWQYVALLAGWFRQVKVSSAGELRAESRILSIKNTIADACLVAHFSPTDLSAEYDTEYMDVRERSISLDTVASNVPCMIESSLH